MLTLLNWIFFNRMILIEVFHEQWSYHNFLPLFSSRLIRTDIECLLIVLLYLFVLQEWHYPRDTNYWFRLESWMNDITV